MFDLDQFREDCIQTRAADDRQQAVRELLASAVGEPRNVIQALGEPLRAGVETLYHAADLTILDVRFAPGMDFYPHDHRMWAVIGIYNGQEDNVFFRRRADSLSRKGTRSLRVGDVNPLGNDVIHAVSNPLGQLTCAIHIYGGDFFNEPRSQWDPQTLEEQPYDTEAMRRFFEEANQRMRESNALTQDRSK